MVRFSTITRYSKIVKEFKRDFIKIFDLFDVLECNPFLSNAPANRGDHFFSFFLFFLPRRRVITIQPFLSEPDIILTFFSPFSKYYTMYSETLDRSIVIFSRIFLEEIK